MKKINAFIVSTNGNIYETSAWSAAEPILTYYQNQRDSYWARAKKEWRNFAYWALRAAASEVSVTTVEGVPRVWSTCVSGSPDYTTNDCFVPTKDNFWGKELKMTAPNMRGVTKDISIVCDKVSHLDYAVKFDDLPNIFLIVILILSSMCQRKMTNSFSLRIYFGIFMHTDAELNSA